MSLILSFRFQGTETGEQVSHTGYFPLFKEYFLFFNYAYVYLSIQAYACECSACGDQKGASEPLEVELHASLLTWVLEIRLGSSLRAASVLLLIHLSSSGFCFFVFVFFPLN